MAPRILKVAKEPRVLSIQSHTVHGYVGNKSAVFPMQTLGLEVDFVNSVQFCNHTGYASFAGSSLDGEELSKLISGLEANELLTHSHLLTGYMRSASLARSVADTLSKLRRRNPDVIYVCDPVMGDHGQLYVPEEMVTCYREEIAPLASVLTPNQFEAEILSGVKIVDIPSALQAVDALHELGIPCVVITSLSLPDDPDTITLIASLVHSRSPQQGGGSLAEEGGGASAGATSGADLKTVVEHATATVQAVLQKTLEVSDGTVRSRELRLIACRHLIADPQHTLSAQIL